MLDLIIPDWPVSERVKSLVTTRQGGFSSPPYDGFNLGDHVGDDPGRVARNRSVLQEQAGLPGEPFWLTQVHGCEVAECGTMPAGQRADAATTSVPGQVCAVLTADCLPLLLCNRAGTRITVVHAGWRGLAEGVIEAGLSCFEDAGDEILAWLGPAIGPGAFEVGDEVRDLFLHASPDDACAFLGNGPGHWLADIYLLARNRLQDPRISFVGGGGFCTFTEQTRFFSYRRDGITGRMASLIWITE